MLFMWEIIVNGMNVVTTKTLPVLQVWIIV